jgi:hypothetical protein
VSDAAGDPLLMVMAEPAASLAAELRRLILPDIGGQRHPSSRDALPRKTIRPARQSRSSNCSRAASIDRRPNRATSMRIA